MPFPLILTDFTDQPEMMRINPDASITVLDWKRVLDWSIATPTRETGFLIAFCRVLQGARYNFLETSIADSDAMEATYHGLTVINQKGEHPGSGGGIYGMTEDFVWQINWKALEKIERSCVTPDNAALFGFLNLFFAGRDNFVTAPLP